MRLSACLGFALHIIHPTAFALSDKHFRRAGLDYGPASTLIEHDDFDRFDVWRRQQGRRLILLTTKAEQSAYGFRFEADDILMVGRETAGVPPEVADTADGRIRIPMRADSRSLNVAIAAAMVLGEAYRQTEAFEELQ